MTISAPAKYQFNRLLAFGIGYKSDKERSAGGKSEGGKIAPLLLLSRGVVSQFQYSSEDWKLEFYLDFPEVSYEDDEMIEAQGGRQRALYAQLKNSSPIEGSELKIKTKNREFAQLLIEGKDMFYHRGHPDFEHPDIETRNGEQKIAGFKYHPGTEGAIYINGQQMEFTHPDSWRKVPDFTFWSFKTPSFNGVTMPIERDRHPINTNDLEELFLPFLIESMTQEEKELAFWLLSDFFPMSLNYNQTPLSRSKNSKVGKAFLGLLIEALAKEKTSFQFDEKYLASSGTRELDQYCSENLGKIICERELAKVGMQTTNQYRKEMHKHLEVEPNPNQARRIKALEDIFKAFFEAYPASTKELSINYRGVRLLQPLAESLMGLDRKNPRYIYLSLKRIDGNHYDAIATYMHELCHESSFEHDGKFAHSITRMFGFWNEFVSEHPRKMINLRKEWEKDIVYPHPEKKGSISLFPYESIAKYREALEPYSAEYQALLKNTDHREDFSIDFYEQNPNLLEKMINLFKEALDAGGKEVDKNSLSVLLQKIKAIQHAFMMIETEKELNSASDYESGKPEARAKESNGLYAKIRARRRLIEKYFPEFEDKFKKSKELPKITRSIKKQANNNRELHLLQEALDSYEEDLSRYNTIRANIDKQRKKSLFQIPEIENVSYDSTRGIVFVNEVPIDGSLIYYYHSLLAQSIFYTLKGEGDSKDQVKKAVKETISIINRLFANDTNRRRKILLTLLQLIDKKYVTDNRGLASTIPPSLIMQELPTNPQYI